MPDVARTITHLVDEIQSVDPEGDAFRYPVSAGVAASATLPCQPNFTTFLGRFAAEAEQVLTWLDGADTGIGVCLDCKQATEAEWRAEMAYYAPDPSDYY